MKILAIADEECKALWDYFTPDKLAGVDLIIACGDLNRHYLEYLATMAPMPVLYVHGNHDESYDLRPPQGVICIDDDVYVHNGLRIAGLGGGCRYRTGAWQFTEAEMKKRVNRLRGKIDRHGGLDILVTHAPMHGYGDLTDLPHRGFTAFSVLLDRYHPQLMLHGHIHSRGDRTNARNRDRERPIFRYDVGLDANEYKPVSRDQILGFFGL